MIKSLPTGKIMQLLSIRKTRSRIGLLLLAYVAFISLGLPDGLLGVAWPSLRTDFSLPLDALGALLIAGTAGYLTSSFFSGQVMSRMGVGGLLAASCFATGASLLGFTLVPAWGFIIVLGVVAGLGAGAIDAGINTYVASNYGEGLMQWLHASFGVGITLGPLIMITGINYFNSWRVGYIVVGSAQITLALCFALTVGLWKNQNLSQKLDGSQRLMDYKTSLVETLRQPGAWLSIALFFIYTGIELTLGHWVYTLLTEARGIAPGVAGVWAGGFWGTFTLGRILAGLFAGRINLKILLRACLLTALFGSVLLWWNPNPWMNLIAVALTGFAIAPIFPGLVSGTSKRVSARHAANTIGMQISAAGLGVAVIPSLAGVLAQRSSLEIIPVFLVFLLSILFLLYTLSLKNNASS
jgi:fucose permease